MTVIFGEDPGYVALYEQDVADRVVAADLTRRLMDETVVTAPVGYPWPRDSNR